MKPGIAHLCTRQLRQRPRTSTISRLDARVRGVGRTKRTLYDDVGLRAHLFVAACIEF